MISTNRGHIRVAGQALLLAALLSTSVSAARGGVRFRGVADGMGEAQATGKPMLFFFTAEWCHPCREIKERVFDVPAIARLIEANFVPIQVLDRRREEKRNPRDVDMALKWLRVQGFPTVVACRVDGTDAMSEVGFSSRQASLSFLKRAIGKLRTESAAESGRKE